MFNWFRRKKPFTIADTMQMRAKLDRKAAIEDALFDEYYALPDRPRPIEMRAAISGCPLEPTETIDVAHWYAWWEKRKGTYEL